MDRGRRGRGRRCRARPGRPGQVVAPIAFGLLLAVIQVVSARRYLRRAYPVGMSSETVIGPHRLDHLMGTLALPQVTGVRPEGRLFRLDHGKDHVHVLPDHVDVEVVRRRAGVPAPAPTAAGQVVVVPSGLGARAARRTLLWRTWRDTGSLVAWGAGAFVLALGQPELAAAIVVAQAAALLATASLDRRQFDRAFPPGIPLATDWHGWELEVASAEGTIVVPVSHATGAGASGDLFVVRRDRMPPLPLPDVVVSEAVRAELLRTN